MTVWDRLFSDLLGDVSYDCRGYEIFRERRCYLPQNRHNILGPTLM